MCGIIGIQGKNYKNVKNSIELISHRGPDDSGYLSDNELLGLGHTRLSIQDTSTAANQPMIHSETGIVIIFNGEIYNFKQLRRSLINEGYKFSNNSDTEVLIILYLKYGEKIFNYINGIFSFSIWDPRFSTLLIARDRYGVKPLYYSNTEENFIFSSEIKSMLPLMNKEFNYNCLSKYLSFLYCPGIETPFKSIYKVLPGEAIVVKKGNIIKRWNFDEEIYQNKSKFESNFNQLLESTESNLREAVHRQMISDVPLGAFLSGGLDSSAIVKFAKELNPEIQCFSIESFSKSISMNKKSNEDIFFARKVSKFLDVQLNVVDVNLNKWQMILKK